MRRVRDTLLINATVAVAYHLLVAIVRTLEARRGLRQVSAERQRAAVTYFRS